MTRHLLAILLVSGVVLPGVAPPAKDDTRWLADASQAERLRRVERGMPAVSLPDGQSLQMDVEQWMDSFKVPGLSIAVFDNFRVVWMKSYGVREVGTSLPVTLETTFQAGSISKPVTALAVMRFVQEGKFSLDEDINHKLSSWKVPENAFTAREKVTLRRLLSHSAGTTVHGFPGYAVGEPIPTTVQVLEGQTPANTAPVRVVMVPGTKYEYSGGGLTIVQLMLVEQLKKPFPQIMQETVLEPLGLKHSSYEQPQPPARAAYAATGHRPSGKPVEGKWHLYPEMAAAGLWTTAGDLAEVALEVAKSKYGKSNRVLSQATTEQMLTVQAAPVGLGFFLGPKSDQFGHDGSDEGFLAALVAFSDSGKGVAIMTNSDSGFALFGPLTASIAKEYGWTGFTPQPTSHFIRFLIVSRKLGVEKALADYASQRAQGLPKDFRPDDLNGCGYALLSTGQTGDALRVFEANVALYPDDANAYDSLGEAFMNAGKTDLAITNYQRSLRMNPNNGNAVKMLAKLGVNTALDAGAK
jgi:CubicO group peptidase (beta-lactamase class C family)